MITFREWQVLNESTGRFNLGIKSPKSVGISGSKLAEMGFPPEEDMEDADDNQDPNLEDSISDFGGEEDMGMEEIPEDDNDGPIIDLSDIDPHLLSLLGIKLGMAAKKAVAAKKNPGTSAAPMPNDDGMGGIFNQGSEESDDDSGEDLNSMFGSMGDTPDFGGDEGEESFDDEAPDFGEESEDGENPFEDEESGEESEVPDFGGEDEESEESEDGENPFEDEESGEESEVPDFGGEDEESEEDDDEEEEEAPPKFMKKDKKSEYNKKHVKKDGKSYMCGSCKNMTKEEATFFNSIIGNGRGENDHVWNSGLPGKVGYPAKTRIGQNW